MYPKGMLIFDFFFEKAYRRKVYIKADVNDDGKNVVSMHIDYFKEEKNDFHEIIWEFVPNAEQLLFRIANLMDYDRLNNIPEEIKENESENEEKTENEENNNTNLFDFLMSPADISPITKARNWAHTLFSEEIEYIPIDLRETRYKDIFIEIMVQGGEKGVVLEMGESKKLFFSRPIDAIVFIIVNGYYLRLKNVEDKTFDLPQEEPNKYYIGHEVADGNEKVATFHITLPKSKVIFK